MDSLSIISRIDEHRKHNKLYNASEINNSPKRRKAKEIYDAEQTKAKKSQLECLFVQQFQGKYGGKGPNSKLNKVIKEIVLNFIDTHTVEECNNQIRLLENEIIKKTNEIKNDVITTKQAKEEARAKSGSKPETVVESEKANQATLVPIVPTQWSVINTIQTISLEEEKQKERQKVEAKRQKFKSELDTQLAVQEIRKKEKQEENARIRAENDRINENLRKEKERLKMLKDKKFEADRELIMEQINLTKQRKLKEKEDSIRQDHIDMEIAKMKAKEEEDLKQSKKLEIRRNQELLKQENDMVKAIQAEAHRKQMELDKIQETEYIEKLRREDEARANAFETRMQKMQIHGLKFATEGAGKKQMEDAKREEERMLKEIARKEQMDSEKERLKILNAKERTRAAQEFNLTVIERKKKEKEEQIEQNRLLQERFMKEAQEAKEMERKALAARKQKASAVAHNLTEQIEDRIKRSHEDKNSLSVREIQLNKDLISKIEKDPELQRKIQEKLNPPSTQRVTRSNIM